MVIQGNRSWEDETRIGSQWGSFPSASLLLLHRTLHQRLELCERSTASHVSETPFPCDPPTRTHGQRFKASTDCWLMLCRPTVCMVLLLFFCSSSSCSTSTLCVDTAGGPFPAVRVVPTTTTAPPSQVLQQMLQHLQQGQQQRSRSSACCPSTSFASFLAAHSVHPRHRRASRWRSDAI